MIYPENQNDTELIETQQNQSSSALSSSGFSACTQCGKGLQVCYAHADSVTCEPWISQEKIINIIVYTVFEKDFLFCFVCLFVATKGNKSLPFTLHHGIADE